MVDVLLLFGIGILAFGICMIPSLIETMDKTDKMVDEMILDWSQDDNCDRLLFMKILVEDKPLADWKRPDMRQTLDERINELNCEKNG